MKAVMFSIIITLPLHDIDIKLFVHVYGHNMAYNVFSISGDWYEFGNVDDNILNAVLIGLLSFFILYLFFTPRKVNKPFTM